MQEPISFPLSPAQQSGPASHRKLLAVLCCLPALGALLYVLLSPKPVSRNEIQVRLPEGGATLSLDEVKVDKIDRAYLLQGQSKDQDKLRVRLLVRNNIHSADAYQKLAELPAGRVHLSLFLPPTLHGPFIDLALGKDWELDVTTSSNYGALLRGKLWLFLLGLLLSGLCSFYVARVLYRRPAF